AADTPWELTSSQVVAVRSGEYRVATNSQAVAGRVRCSPCPRSLERSRDRPLVSGRPSLCLARKQFRAGQQYESEKFRWREIRSSRCLAAEIYRDVASGAEHHLAAVLGRNQPDRSTDSDLNAMTAGGTSNAFHKEPPRRIERRAC